MAGTEFGRALRIARRESNKALAEVALAAGLSVKEINALEDGKHQPADETIVAKLEEAVGVPAGELLALAEIPEVKPPDLSGTFQEITLTLSDGRKGKFLGLGFVDLSEHSRLKVSQIVFSQPQSLPEGATIGLVTRPDDPEPPGEEATGEGDSVGNEQDG